MDPRAVTDRETFRLVASDAAPGARVPVEARVAVADPFDAYRRALVTAVDEALGDRAAFTVEGSE